MTTDQLWAGVDVGKEHHWICVVDATGAVVLSRKLVNDEQAIRAVIAEIDTLGKEAVWTVDLTMAYAALLLTVLADAGKPVPIDREGRPFSTCALAFSESWTEAR